MIYDLLMSYKAEVMQLKKQISKSNNTNKKLFYNYVEVSEILCISVEGVRSKVKRGSLQRTCNDNTPLISRESLNSYFKKQNPNFEGI